ncbi:MAG: DUF542 domain-containing protein [bacterium]
MSDSRSNCASDSITADCTVDAVIKRVPAAVAVLNQHNIDTCCGGRTPLGEAATHAHVDTDALIGILESVQRGETTPSKNTLPIAASCNCGGH